eukprot:TRINITY_DN985_c0_g1_i1.p1 TRINITY_DN985_c0_g1~~TRINITY_DN985_c0_g1_i1.p1  ORF type:complete len:260 (+),score=70.33 TRINITY_DN985_c0_g1_i1:56-781(+)
MMKNNQELRFRDTRKFGTYELVKDTKQRFAKLGPEPLDDAFTVDVLRKRLDGRKTMLKPLLLNQSFVAGIGNIYADETLFDCRLHPERTADTLKSDEIASLHASIRKILQLGIDREGASVSTYVLPSGEKGSMQDTVMCFRRTGSPCFVCGEKIERIVLAQRSTHFCARCQSPSSDSGKRRKTSTPVRKTKSELIEELIDDDDDDDERIDELLATLHDDDSASDADDAEQAPQTKARKRKK